MMDFSVVQLLQGSDVLLLFTVLGFGLLGIWILQGGSRALQSVTFLLSWKSRSWRHIRV